MAIYLGVDIGTSGVRTAVIDPRGECLASASIKMEAPIHMDNRPCQDASYWWETVRRCLQEQAQNLQAVGYEMRDIQAVSVDGTSCAMLLVDAELKPLTYGYMYNSARFDEEAAAIDAVAPKNSIARGPGSGLARLLFLQKQTPIKAAHVLHQADWIAAQLMQRGGFSDETNALKTGYDVEQRKWPDWFAQCGVQQELLPAVRPVGDCYDRVGEEIAAEFGFSRDLKVIAGVTDSNAAFLASGASQIGEGVTSLGTTLAIKLLSDRPVSDPSRGVYSHRIKNMWLPGGASNTGGGVLLDHFTAEQMAEMESLLTPAQPTGLDYYPLSRPGERFPIADPQLPPRLTPRPQSDAVFFQGMLGGISEIERIGYAALQELGAAKLKRVFTAGGGAKNQAWAAIRATQLGVPIVEARSSDAAVGVARIAARLV